MNRKILENVRIFREKANLSQESLAEKLHITQSKYARFERGATKTDLETLMAFCDVIGVTLVDLITYPNKYVDVDEIPSIHKDGTVMLSIEIKKEKKDEVMNLVFGDKNLEILNK